MQVQISQDKLTKLKELLAWQYSMPDWLSEEMGEKFCDRIYEAVSEYQDQWIDELGLEQIFEQEGKDLYEYSFEDVIEEDGKHYLHFIHDSNFSNEDDEDHQVDESLNEKVELIAS